MEGKTEWSGGVLINLFHVAAYYNVVQYLMAYKVICYCIVKLCVCMRACT
jgi:hypothetical protein